jgi:hypothetical protein
LTLDYTRWWSRCHVSNHNFSSSREV